MRMMQSPVLFWLAVLLVIVGGFIYTFGHPFSQERMAYVCKSGDPDPAVESLRMACPENEELPSGTLASGEE